MLNTIYKIIAKLIAQCLRLLLPYLIHPHQIGFVPRRQILENVSITNLVIDWALHHNYPTFLLLLHFEKAFDQVDFDYIWAMLTTLGLGGKFLQLVKGLILRAHVKIHMNGRFSTEVKIEHGVCQG